MNKILLFLIMICSLGSTNAQVNLNTQIERIEIYGKEIKTTYKVFILRKDKWIEATRTATGFAVPAELRTEEHLALLITFGKHKLEFPDIHGSKLEEKWIVGVDKKPFSKDLVTPEEARTAKRVYFINFQGIGLGTQLVVIQKR